MVPCEYINTAFQSHQVSLEIFRRPPIRDLAWELAPDWWKQVATVECQRAEKKERIKSIATTEFAVLTPLSLGQPGLLHPK